MKVLILCISSTTALWCPHSCMLGKSSSKCTQRRSQCYSGNYGHYPFTDSEEHLGFKGRASSIVLHRPQQVELGAAKDGTVTVVVGKPDVYLLEKAAWVLWHFVWPIYSSQLSFGESSKRFCSTLPDADSSKRKFGRFTERLVPQRNQRGQRCLAA